MKTLIEMVYGEHHLYNGIMFESNDWVELQRTWCQYLDAVADASKVSDYESAWKAVHDLIEHRPPFFIRGRR